MIVEEEPCLGTKEEEEEEDRLADIAEDWENVRLHVKENKGNPDASDIELGPEEDGSDEERADEDGSDDDEVAPELPVVRQSATECLKAVANSVEHKLSHLPNNPFCQSCG